MECGRMGAQQVIDQFLHHYEDGLCCYSNLFMSFTVAFLDDAMTIITYDGYHGETVGWNLETGEVSTL